MGVCRTIDPARQTRRQQAPCRGARSDERDHVYFEHGMPVACDPERSAAAQHTFRLSRLVELRRHAGSHQRTPPALPEIGREAPATVCAPLVVSLPWRVTARCPIVDPDLAPRRSAILVLVAAMVLTARRLLRFLVLGRSNRVLRLRRDRGRDRWLAR